MMKPSGNGRQIFESRFYMFRTFFKNSSALILRERPPLRGLANWDERGTICLRAAERRLFLDELILLHTSDVAFVTCYSSKKPLDSRVRFGYLPRSDIESFNLCQRRPGNSFHTDNTPNAFVSTNESKLSGIREFAAHIDQQLIHRQIRIHFPRPGVDAALEILHLFKACACQQFERTRGARSAFAKYDHVFGAVQFGQTPRKLT